ncbi:MAG: IPT/TIG domain-containing protein [Candidatus Bathyarchaeota archaeon]|nr:IPT/TIG domain-containing protein [Candidatus Termiticorpusculum sp.]
MNTVKSKNKLMATMICMLLFASTMLAVVPAAKADSVTVFADVDSGAVGKSVFIGGAGLEADAVITIDFDDIEVVADTDGVTTTSVGALMVFITVPAVAPDVYDISVYADEDLVGTIEFTVIETSISLSPDNGIAGTTVTVTGAGFLDDDVVTITFDGDDVVTTPAIIEVGATGSFSATFTVPDVVADEYDVEAFVDAELVATAQFTIPEPTVTASPLSGRVGTIVTVTGSNFVGDEVTVTLDTEDETENIVAGAFSVDITVPDLGATSGVYKIEVSIDGVLYDEITFDYIAGRLVVLAPKAAYPNKETVVEVTGSGFDTDAVITIEVDGTAVATVPTPLETDDKGEFTATITIPAGPQGSHTIKVSDPTEFVVTIFEVSPVVTLTVDDEPIPDNQMPSGTVITVNGFGFTPNAVVNIHVNDGAGTLSIPVKTKLTVAVDGTFATDVIVPSVPVADNYVFFASNEIDAAGATLMINEVTTLVVEPKIGMPGKTTFTVTGTNFAVLEGNTVSFLIGTYAIETVYDVEADGSFEVEVTLPANIPAGKYTFAANDVYGLNAFDTIWVAAPVVVVDPNVVYTGNTTTVTGFGFDAFGDGDYLANITIGGILVAEEIEHADLYTGVKVLVPTLPLGEHKVVVTTDTGVVGEATITILKTTTLVAVPESTLRDADVEITGSHFTAQAGVPVTVIITSMEDDSVIYNSTLAGDVYLLDADGAFTMTYHVPPTLALGEYLVTATDKNGLFDDATFEVVALTLIITTADFYFQGNLGRFEIATNAPTSGTITVTLPDGSSVTLRTSTSGDWRKNAKTEMWEYYESSNVLGKGITFQIPNDAVTTNATELAWTWEAVFKDAAYTVEAEGEFDVYTSFADSPGSSNPGGGSGSGTGAQGPAGPAGAPGEKGEKGDTGAQGSSGSSGSAGARGSDGAKGADGATGPAGAPGAQGQAGADAPTGTLNAALIIAIVALIVGALAAFLVFTMKRKIAN